LAGLEPVEPGVVATHQWRPADTAFADTAFADISDADVSSTGPWRANPDRTTGPDGRGIGHR